MTLRAARAAGQAGRSSRPFALPVGAMLALASAPAPAADDHLELWFNPVAVVDLGNRNFVELDTQQRFREQPAGDTYVARLGLGREIAEGVTATVGLHRGREGDVRETRFMQQLAYPLAGPMRGRTRIEQRLVDGSGRTGLRLRQRVQASVPLSSRPGGWAIAANAEGFFTLRPTAGGGDTGLTGVRTYVGVERDFARLRLGLGYTRQHSIRKGAPDRIGHAPTLALIFRL